MTLLLLWKGSCVLPLCLSWLPEYKVISITSGVWPTSLPYFVWEPVFQALALITLRQLRPPSCLWRKSTSKSLATTRIEKNTLLAPSPQAARVPVAPTMWLCPRETQTIKWSPFDFLTVETMALLFWTTNLGVIHDTAIEKQRNPKLVWVLMGCWGHRGTFFLSTSNWKRIFID